MVKILGCVLVVVGVDINRFGRGCVENCWCVVDGCNCDYGSGDGVVCIIVVD